MKRQAGISILEAILAATILGLLAQLFVAAFVYSESQSSLDLNRQQALWLADEGLLATTNIRDASFVSLTDGQSGLSDQSGQWQLTGSSDQTGIFQRVIEISTIDADTKQVRAIVSWGITTADEHSVSLETTLTDWNQ